MLRCVAFSGNFDLNWWLQKFLQTGYPYQFFWADQQKTNFKLFSWAKCEINKIRRIIFWREMTDNYITLLESKEKQTRIKCWTLLVTRVFSRVVSHKTFFRISIWWISNSKQSYLECEWGITKCFLGLSKNYRWRQILIMLHAKSCFGMLKAFAVLSIS